MKYFKIKVPATTSNLGPGFDVIGAALGIYNEVAVSYGKRHGNAGPLIQISGEGADTLPRDSRNIVWKSMKLAAGLCGKKIDPSKLRIKLINHIPLASGMGSSAAARLAGIMAAYKLAGRKPDLDEVMRLGVRLEGHPDNIVPALLGGICVCANHGENVKVLKLPLPALKAVICNPDFGVSTNKARKLLPVKLPFKDAVFNTSRLALFMAALQLKRYDLLKYGMQDRLHQPYRAKLVPGMNGVFEAALRAGASGVSLSGAGPSIIALSAPAKAKKVAAAMRGKWKRSGKSSRCFILNFKKRGISI
jgi:homoserine kinase